MNLLNLGCGNCYHQDWINLDYISNQPGIKVHDLHEKLPFNNQYIDVVYTSHVLEHFQKCFAPVFLKECYRVLKKGGVIRVVVPDLEKLIKNYISFLERAKNGDKEAGERYEWTMIELFDQMVRNYSGGEMLNYWKQNPMPQENFIIERLGSEVKDALKIIRSNSKMTQNYECKQESSENIGIFRKSGEVHQWMYDEYSLGKLLHEVGFSNVKKVNANESLIDNFSAYFLDVEADGQIRKPDSLYMEAQK